MRKLSRFLKPFRRQVVLGPIFKMIEAIFELIVPLVMASLIDVGIKNGNSEYVWKMGGILLLLGVVGLASSLTCQFFASRASQGFGTIVRKEMFQHINTLSHTELDKWGTPSLITRLNNDVNQLQLAVAMLIRLVFRAPFLVIGATIMAMSLDLELSVIFIITAVVISFSLYIVMSHTVPFYGVVQRLLDRVSLITRENIEGARVIRAFSKQRQERDRFIETSNELKSSSIRIARLSALLNPVTTIAANCAIVGIVWFGGIRVNVGTLTQGEVIALWNYMTQILLALIVVANLVIIFTKASASGKRVNEIFEQNPSVSDIGNQIVYPIKNAAKIQFDHVSFSYHGQEKECLTDINFAILSGETVGIIGGTGSGKSTMVNLIPRFYEVGSGKVLVDGVDVRDYPFAQLRRLIGFVPQQGVVFSGTIRENMKWGCQDANDAQINKALEIAQAKEFVDKLPDGLNTKILQGGVNLSGGQKQRLTIARAITGKPEILILDDSASALDFATEAKLRMSIRQETKGTTVLLISQRVNSVKDADKIIVLEDDGEIAGIGSHQELFDNCQVYQEICLSQLSGEEVKRA